MTLWDYVRVPGWTTVMLMSPFLAYFGFDPRELTVENACWYAKRFPIPIGIAAVIWMRLLLFVRENRIFSD